MADDMNAPVTHSPLAAVTDLAPSSPPGEPEPPAAEALPDDGVPAAVSEPLPLAPAAVSEPSPASPEAPAEAADEPAPEQKKHWYVVKVTSGREDTIKEAIERRVRKEGL